MALKVLILGINGFIGNSLAEQILQQTDWEVYGLDLAQDKLTSCLQHPRLHFTEGDITIHRDWVEYHIKKCDVILPLVAIATPATYVQNPLRIFELDFEANLAIIRLCVKYHKRVIFPSTSEVYGMCTDEEFDEETSNLIQGPINKPRWIYSCSKQLLDRVITAYGERDGLRYTLFRPFNWLGPKLDNILETKAGGSRVITQFIGDILRQQEIKLVDGGQQRRCFIDIADGVNALIKIIANDNNGAENKIFNIGNPANDFSIRELAELLITLLKEYPKYADLALRTKLVDISGDQYYGKGYQDVGRRVPSIKKAQQYLNWQPRIDLPTSLRRVLDFHLV